MHHLARGALVASTLILYVVSPALAVDGEEEVKGVDLDQAPPVNVHNQLGGGRLAEYQYIAQDLVGMTVVTADGEEMGEVTDFIIDARDGSIDQVVIEVSSIIGYDYTQFGVDWSKVRLERGSDEVALTLTQQEVTEGFRNQDQSPQGQEEQGQGQD